LSFMPRARSRWRFWLPCRSRRLLGCLGEIKVNRYRQKGIHRAATSDPGFEFPFGNTSHRRHAEFLVSGLDDPDIVDITFSIYDKSNDRGSGDSLLAELIRINRFSLNEGDGNLIHAIKLRSRFDGGVGTRC